ncbi:uncharacterized protein LOC121763605 [Salvia splendens]|uniref:uncharacterized protein LOC121763605 n=1 Tax=Salvia splendens TaxID=180675 RepID=UPI001C27A136|nr:uncharacterized protein LOC121763605 [Salvia splendens]
MSSNAEAAGFFLPSEFLDDLLLDKENLTESDPEFCFPTEFPYDFGAKSDELLQKRWVMSTSPQSTLSHLSSWAGSTNGSPNGFPSPPTTPKNDAVGDLVYLAAGQLAKLKLNADNGLHAAAAKTPNPSLVHSIYLQQQMVKQKYQMRTGQEPWPVQPDPTRIVGSGGRAAAFGSGGAAVKRGCAGTGVFLPRRYGNNNINSNTNNNYIINNNIIIKNDCNAYASDTRKKSAGYSAATIPIRSVHALKKNLDNMNGFAQSLPQPIYHPKLDRGFIPDYDLLMARRNALLLQQQRRSFLLEGSSPINRGAYLPQEWTY